VIAVTINHEGIQPEKLDEVCAKIEKETGRPVIDPLIHGVDALIPIIAKLKK
jgi:uncharacterized NAD-dependent epimerase/dehydratase family protein